MTIYLLRHATAGHRSQWRQDDWLRPLSSAGQAQSRAIIDQYAEEKFDHVLSSTYLRCIETVAPIAAIRRLAIEPVDPLSEGGDLEAVFALISKHIRTGALLCSHGDIIPAVLETLAAKGLDLGPKPRCPKGCTWLLDTDGGSEVTRARYWPPPPVAK